jgi:hypothetical protein
VRREDKTRRHGLRLNLWQQQAVTPRAPHPEDADLPGDARGYTARTAGGVWVRPSAIEAVAAASTPPARWRPRCRFSVMWALLLGLLLFVAQAFGATLSEALTYMVLTKELYELLRVLPDPFDSS